MKQLPGMPAFSCGFEDCSSDAVCALKKGEIVINVCAKHFKRMTDRRWTKAEAKKLEAFS